jgi:hypothetical protein
MRRACGGDCAECGDTVEEALAAGNTALALDALSRSADACAAFERALEIAHRAGEQDIAVSCLVLLAGLLERVGKMVALGAESLRIGPSLAQSR